MTTYPKVPLEVCLSLNRQSLTVEPDQMYRPAGVLNHGRGLFAKEPLRGSDTSYKTLYCLQAGQIVYSRLFAFEGSAALVTDEFDGCVVSQEFPTFNVRREVAVPEYLGHVMRWPTFHEQLSKGARGLGQRRQRVHPDYFLSLTCPLPPRDEQLRIASELAEWNRRIRDLRGQAERSSPEAMKRTLPTLIDAAFSEAGAGRVLVADVVTLVSDVVHPGEDPRPAASFIGLQHIESHTGRQLGADNLGSEKGRKFRFRPGDVVYGYLRPYLNKAWVANCHGLCSVDQYVLRPKPGISADLVGYALRGRSALDQSIDLTHSLQLPRLRSGLLLGLQVPSAVRGDDRLLASKLARIQGAVVAAADLREGQVRLVEALAGAVMNQAFAQLG